MRGLQHGGRGEAEQARHDEGGKLRGGVVELQHLVVEGLAGEADAVFRARQLLVQGAHLLVGLQFGVAFSHRQQAPQATAQGIFSSGQGAQMGGVQGLAARAVRCLHGLATGGHHGLQGAGFVL